MNEPSFHSIKKDLLAIDRPVTLVAVSKMQSVESIEALYQLGQRDFGENYVQELVSKAEALKGRGCADIRWHFIGHLQTNKVKALLPYVHCIHSVDSEKLALELEKRLAATERAAPLEIFVEVNIDQEASKSGATPEQALSIAQKIRAACPHLRLLGLMCIPSFEGTEEETREAFSELRKLSEKLGTLTQGSLSMGMSSDYKIALENAATHVRIGTAIFGSRPRK